MSRQEVLPIDYGDRLTIPEAARVLGCSDDTIRRRIKDGTLPAVLIAGKYRIRHQDLLAMVESAA